MPEKEDQNKGGLSIDEELKNIERELEDLNRTISVVSAFLEQIKTEGDEIIRKCCFNN